MVAPSSSQLMRMRFILNLGHTFINSCGALKVPHITRDRDKTVAVKFRPGGHIAATDELRLLTQPLAYVNHFSYMGVTLPANGRSFSAHVTDRCRRPFDHQLDQEPAVVVTSDGVVFF